MRKKREPRLERWIVQAIRMVVLIRAITVLVDALTDFVVRSRMLVISVALLALTIVGCITLL